MTLATRCPACGTTFKVVQDQLKVSNGFVRCGRCSEVFDAIEGLFEAGSPMAPFVLAPPVVPMPGGDGARSAATRGSGLAPLVSFAPPGPPVGPAAAAPSPLDRSERSAYPSVAPRARSRRQRPGEAAPLSAPFAPFAPDAPDAPDSTKAARETPSDAAPAELVAPPSISGEAPGEANPASFSEAAAAVSFADDSQAMAGDPEPAAAGGAASEPAALSRPGFLREADRAEHWRSPRIRAVLAGAAVLLALLLALQAGIAWRDTVAATWPASRPWLMALCQRAGCEVQPLRRIGAMAVESSGLNQVAGTTIYRLALVLRNRADVELMLPSLDLVLSDSQGAVLARRVIGMNELGTNARSLAGGAELTLQASLNAGERRVAGYTIELFYP